MKTRWVVYLVFAICYKIGVFFCLRTIINYNFNAMDTLYIVFFIGLFGFSFNRCILSKRIWRYIFAVSVILYSHTWIVMPSQFLFVDKIPLLDVLHMMIFNVPLLPLLYALYSYAWRSEALWGTSVKQ